ncbi:reverse transcriptase domain-containing protein [Tanacetum coccineum]|uniref:Reverse transcriptase domain-containing protein n=1 Tax=Tanacetum coccineum TaxID=301880 RepID=A0ABQ5DZK6_9ASTR
MTHLLMKDAKFDFSDDCKKAFNNLKVKLTTTPIKISPDWNIPFELMCNASDFPVGAVLGQMIDGKLKPIYYASKTLNDAQAHYTTTEKELLAVVFSFDKFRPYLILSKTIVYTDYSALKYLFSKQDAKPRLIRLENPSMWILTEKEITDEFPDEHLMVLKTTPNDDEPWYADYVNYIVVKVIPPKWTTEKRKRFFSQVKYYFWDEPYAFRLCLDNIMRRCVIGNEIPEILAHCHSGPTGGHHSASITGRKVYESGFFWPSIFRDAKDYVSKYYVSKWVEAQALPTNDARVVVKFLKGLFARFGVPKALISDRGTHFCNSQLEKALQKYSVTHKISTAYHPQTNGQTKVTNRAIKRILERSVGYNPKDWSEKLNDTLWAFRTAYKTPTRYTPFSLVYGKACHLPVEIELKAYWALKQCNMDLPAAAKNCFMALNELMKLQDWAYENTQIYKETTKKWHDSRIRGDKNFKTGDKDLLFNSKLRSKWSGPFTVKTVYPYGAVEITDKNNFSFKVNGHMLKKYYDGYINTEGNELVELDETTG